MIKYIFVVGGVLSSVGKGIAAASSAKLLESRGYNVTCVKIDPYINVDAGTMHSSEHGEVFVTEDGDETDQDIGNYERFLDKDILSSNYMTTGRVYRTVINDERNLKYKGKCVEVVPHIPLEVIRRIKKAAKKTKADIVITEIGGTVGEYQNLLFLEAARMMKLEQPKDVAFIMVSYLPILKMVGEIKTKPTQAAVRVLNSAGIQPDILLCRAEEELDDKRREKLSISCNMTKDCIISAPDVKLIYDIALNFKKGNLDDRLIEILGLEIKEANQKLAEWAVLAKKIKTVSNEINIGILGTRYKNDNYVLEDSYLSVIEAIKHAAWFYNKKPVINWIYADEYETNPNKLSELISCDGIIIPDSFELESIEGKIKVISFIREHHIPFLGLGQGMQLAVIEFARLLGLEDATIEGDNYNSKNIVIQKVNYQRGGNNNLNYKEDICLGAYPCLIKKGTKAYDCYQKEKISERHRHRYQFNNQYRHTLEAKGLIISGMSPNQELVEIIELANHPFYIGTQFHPEFKSRPLKPHPLFLSFIEALASKRKSSLKACQ